MENPLMQTLVELHTQFPNDQELGAEVRILVWQYIRNNSPSY